MLENRATQETRNLISGNEAIGWGALAADCVAFFGYPITPQNEVTEWFAREFPKKGRLFLQVASETSAINMLWGAAAAGDRIMTSTSGPGWSLMQEGLSDLANSQLPCVVVLVQRQGPGGGGAQHAQMDYLSVTKGGGHGGYRNISLAPASVQEIIDFMQLAFHLADRYRNPVIIMSDAVTGRTMETAKIRKLDFGPLPEKEWAVRGVAHNKDGKRRVIQIGTGAVPEPPYLTYMSLIEELDRKFREMANTEVRCETYHADDAVLLLVAQGYVARVCKEAVNMARSRGLKVGLIRPITLWPFPYGIMREKAAQGANFLVVEDNLGQMVDDVRLGVEGQAKVHLLSMLARHLATDSGFILPSRVVEEIEKLLATT